MTQLPAKEQSQHAAIDMADSLVRWAAGEGVKLDGIEPKETAEHGFGMVAIRKLQVPKFTAMSYTSPSVS